MKEKNVPTCPGCKKHCPLTAVRCKYGRNYIEKMNTAKEKPLNWKKRINHDGELHLLLATAKRIKGALKHSECTEAQLVSHIAPEQLAILSDILKKISEKLPEPV